ncbi:hypothetical protein AKG38_12770 [Pectobacterium carotovorum subsp. carotovorum]|nr:hypothetical protein [Pectobacterium carotovorum subsp. carotovorum]PWD65687.1 hypothetical protein DF215_21075 [Pectobacterium versatile]TAI85798.1 hypothetical protein EG330_08825 [Pectobacterium versatile]TAI94013.1 hypothetical protein EG335_18580 [Pectobacterium versatile]TAJ02905.1 hypothetical protein EG334_16760 [Pectobacterium versatile]
MSEAPCVNEALALARKVGEIIFLSVVHLPVLRVAIRMMMQTEGAECEFCVSFSIILAVFIK